MAITAITADQAKSILKAIVYSFGAGFVASFTLQSADLITAVQSGHGALAHLLVSVIVAAVVGGINGIAFTIEKLLTTK